MSEEKKTCPEQPETYDFYRYDKALTPENIYDVAAVETWLEDKARQGWAVTGDIGIKAKFVREEPAQCRYRLEPLRKKEKRPEEEKLALYGRMGWHYIGGLQGVFSVWRSDDPQAPELDTDPQVQEEGYRHVRRQALGLVAVEVLIAVAYPIVIGWIYLSKDWPLLYAIEELTPGRLPLLLVWNLLLLGLSIYDGVAVYRLCRHLRAGIPLKRPRPYFWPKVLAVTVRILTFLVLVNPVRLFWGEPWDAYDKGTYQTPRPEAVYADLQQVEGTEAETIFFFGPTTKVHDLAPRMWFIRQYTDTRPQAMLLTDYYHMLTEGLAREAVAELVDRTQAQGDDRAGEMSALPTEALEEFWWSAYLQDDGERVQYVVALLGKNVMQITYRGPADLRSQADYFAQLLA